MSAPDAHDTAIARKTLLDWVAMQEQILVDFDYALEDGDEAETKAWCQSVRNYADHYFPEPPK